MPTMVAARGWWVGTVLVLVTASRAVAQDAGALLTTALDRYEERVEGIEDYTVTYSVMGQNVTEHMQKQIVDGHPVFLPADGDPSSRERWDPYGRFPQLAARAEHAGTETLDGVDAHALRIDDFEGLDLGVPAQVQGEFRPRTLTLWIDSGEYLLRGMDLEGVVVDDGQERPLALTARMKDYRTVGGMPHPFRTTMRIEGAMAGAGVSGEEVAQAREQLAELDRQMAEMPESQRQMMEKMMGSQLEQMRRVVESEVFETELVVTDLRVNTGSSSGS